MVPAPCLESCGQSTRRPVAWSSASCTCSAGTDGNVGGDPPQRNPDHGEAPRRKPGGENLGQHGLARARVAE